jgi:hypothetical protein
MSWPNEAYPPANPLEMPTFLFEMEVGAAAWWAISLYRGRIAPEPGDPQGAMGVLNDALMNFRR